MTPSRPRLEVRTTTSADFPQIIELTGRVYPVSRPWGLSQLASHLEIFPEGQFVAVESESSRVVGMASSLILRWDDYDATANWHDFTAGGMFTNHDPRGRTLYGAEVMVEPARQRSGIGAQLYQARRDLTIRLGLPRIRAAARLRGYHRYAHRMSAQEYVEAVVKGEIKGPTLSFQLGQGFRVVGVLPGYLKHDPESLGWAAVIEWLNPEAVAEPSA